MRVPAVCQRCGSKISMHGIAMTTLDFGENAVHYCPDCRAIVESENASDRGVLFRDDSWYYYRRIREHFNELITEFMKKQYPRWVHSNTLFAYVKGFDRDGRISRGSTRTTLKWLLSIGKVKKKGYHDFKPERERGDWWRFVQD